MRRRDKTRLRRLCYSACFTQFSSFQKCVLVVRVNDFRAVKAMLDNNLLPEMLVCVQGWIGMPPGTNACITELESWQRQEFEYNTLFHSQYCKKIYEAWRKDYAPEAQHP